MQKLSFECGSGKKAIFQRRVSNLLHEFELKMTDLVLLIVLSYIKIALAKLF